MNTHIKTWLGATIIIIIAITAGMFVWKCYSLSPISQSIPQTIQTPKLTIKENNVGIANPASVFCEQNGGKLEIITAEDGGQSGMCKFSDGSQCEEWAFQRGECEQLEMYKINQTLNNGWKIIKGGSPAKCDLIIAEGISNIEGWYVYDTSYVEKEWILYISSKSQKELPFYKKETQDQLKVKIIDASEEIKEDLKKVNKGNPQKITIQGWESYCEGIPIVSIEKASEVFKNQIGK
ncbi:MAG: DUF333 domain-containing protein [bacterium]|nr:DUF333 domain-containing protein [bacterium]